MKELTDEQYEAVYEASQKAWLNMGAVAHRGPRTVAAGRAAYAASFPHAVAEACEEPTLGECGAHGLSTPFGYHAARKLLASRLARLTAKPDAAVEAVKVELKRIVFGSNPPPQADEYAAQIVAAVDAARAKEAK